MCTMQIRVYDDTSKVDVAVSLLLLLLRGMLRLMSIRRLDSQANSGRAHPFMAK